LNISWSQKRDLYKAAVLIREELEVGAKAMPIGEVFSGTEHKGGGRDLLEWAVDFLGCVPVGARPKLDKFYFSQADNYKKGDTLYKPLRAQLWKSVRKKGGKFVQEGLWIARELL
jgi:hypothetical protein